MSTNDIFASPHELLPSIRARREEIETRRQLPRDLAAADGSTEWCVMVGIGKTTSWPAT